MKLISKYQNQVILCAAVIVGVLFAHYSFDYIVMPLSPTMIIDETMPSETSPVGYEPVEITGMAISEGKEVLCSCKVPMFYEQYVHYPKAWPYSPFNPNSWIGKGTVYLLYIIAAILLYLLVRKIIKLRKRQKEKQDG